MGVNRVTRWYPFLDDKGWLVMVSSCLILLLILVDAYDLVDGSWMVSHGEWLLDGWLMVMIWLMVSHFEWCFIVDNAGEMICSCSSVSEW